PVKLIRLLISKGAAINSVDSEGNTPVYYAASNGRWDTVKILIEHGADPNLSRTGYTCLHEAAKNGNNTMVEYLISEGHADVNKLSDDGVAAIKLASENDHWDCVKSLLENRANPKIIGSDGRTALHDAVKQDKIEIAKLLISRYADVNCTDDLGQTPLFYSISNQLFDVAHLLLSAKANVNHVNFNGQTVLHLATKLNPLYIFKSASNGVAPEGAFCVENPGESYFVARASISGAINYGKVHPEHGCAYFPYGGEKSETAYEVLCITSGVDAEWRPAREQIGQENFLVSDSDDGGLIAVASTIIENLRVPGKFHVNGSKGYFPYNGSDNVRSIEAVDLLVLKGNLLNSSGDLIQFAIDHGANVNIADINGDTPIHVASAAGDLGYVNSLLSANASVTQRNCGGCTPLHCAATSGSAEIVVQLLKNGADANALDHRNESPLHYAVRSGRLECVSILLVHQAVVNCSCKNSRSPLHLAASSGNPEIIQILVDKGAQLDFTDTEGATPLHLAVQNFHHDCISKLISLGANVRLSTRQKFTALHGVASD
ncbi:hypothetical protein HK096_009136, partial [Nowakowskiella sp. JEL0078]